MLRDVSIFVGRIRIAHLLTVHFINGRQISLSITSTYLTASNKLSHFNFVKGAKINPGETIYVRDADVPVYRHYDPNES